MVKYKHGRGCAYNINYHLVWCSKYRKSVLVGNVERDLREIILQKAKEEDYSIEAFEIMPDHVHIFISVKPSVSAHQVVKRLKGASSNVLRKKYPHLAAICSLWSSSYYAGTVGHASDSVVKMYIENQKGA